MRYSIEERIDQWQNNLQDSGIFTAEQIMELEDHLYLQVDQLLADGKSEEEAFQEASLSLGHPLSLGRAYSQINQRLIIQQLASYLLIGFPILTAVAYFITYSWKLSAAFLVDFDVRGEWLAIGTYLTPMLAILYILIQTAQNPFWCLRIPKQLAKFRTIPFLGLMILAGGLFYAADSYYAHWVQFHNGIHPISYLHYDYTKYLEWLPFLGTPLFLSIYLGLMLSIMVNALLSSNAYSKIWNHARLLIMMTGIYIIQSVSTYISYLLARMGLVDIFESRLLISIIVMAICLALGIPILRWFYRKDRYLVIGE